LLAEWRRVGKAPDHTPVDLGSTIRPQLDEVDKALIAQLEEKHSHPRKRVVPHRDRKSRRQICIGT